jgi:hypothetical protein
MILLLKEGGGSFRNPVYAVLPFQGAAIINRRFTPFQFSKVLKILFISILLKTGFEIFVESQVKKWPERPSGNQSAKINKQYFQYFINFAALEVSVAQLVEQLTLNQRVQGSNPCGDTDNQRVKS